MPVGAHFITNGCSKCLWSSVHIYLVGAPNQEKALPSWGPLCENFNLCEGSFEAPLAAVAAVTRLPPAGNEDGDGRGDDGIISKHH